MKRTKYFTNPRNTAGNRVWRLKNGKFEYWGHTAGYWFASVFNAPKEGNLSAITFTQISRDEARKLEPVAFRKA